MPIHSLRKRSDFLHVARSPHRFRGRWLIVQAHFNQTCSEATQEPTQKQDPHICFGMVVTRKVGGSVIRNQVKRRMRVLVHEAFHKVPCEFPSFHLVLVACHGIKTASFAELKADFDKGCKRLGLFQSPLRDIISPTFKKPFLEPTLGSRETKTKECNDVSRL